MVVSSGNGTGKQAENGKTPSNRAVITCILVSDLDNLNRVSLVLRALVGIHTFAI